MKEYVGDSVYLSFDGFGYKLTTENGKSDNPSNKIYLDPRILKNLIEISERLRIEFDKALVTRLDKAGDEDLKILEES